MNIGDKYSDKKLYRGIRTSNGLPFLAEDFSEFSDTIYNKNRHLLNSILGSGLIKDLDVYYDNIGVGLNSPAIINVEGDICLVKNSEGTYLANFSDMYHSDIRKGIICVVGWYQHVNSSTTLKEYGGVFNKDIVNDLLYEPLDVQVSTRYQIRWDTSVLLVDNINNISSVTIPARDSNGNLLGDTYTIDNLKRVDSIYTAVPPAGMDYVVDKLYIIPLLEYTTIEEPAEIDIIQNIEVRRPNSTNNLIKSTTEPTGRYYEGTVWYNPDTSEFKNYVEGLGFVANSSRMSFLQYQQTDIASEDIETPTHLKYSLEFPMVLEDDIIEVIYEGLTLHEGTEYTIDINSKEITLINFERRIGEKLVINLTRLIDASNVTSLTNVVTKHVNTSANVTTFGHVKLSDSTDSNSDINSGLAATPKAVKMSRILKDSTTNKSYRFIVENGSLYLENTETSARNLLINNII